MTTKLNRTNKIDKWKLAINLMLFLGILIFVDMAFANGAAGTKDTGAALDAMATKATSIFNGGLIKVVINSAGFAAIVYSVVGGFKVGPLIGGVMLIVFHALFSAYTTHFFG